MKQSELIVRIDERVDQIIKSVKLHNKWLIFLTIIFILANLDKAEQFINLFVTKIAFAQ